MTESATASVPDSREPDQWVSTGRESLDSWWSGYPWYDAATDGVRAIHVSPPKAEDATPGEGWNPPGLLEVLGYTVVGILAGVLVYLVVRYLLGRKLRAARADVDSAIPESPIIESLPFAVKQGQGELLAEARRLYEQGDYGRAVLYLYAHQLVQLDRHQMIHLASGKTNRQYLREVGTRRMLRSLVERTMVAFEDVFFGGHAIDRTRFESCWSELPRFDDLLAQEAAT